YKMALSAVDACGILRARSRAGGTLIGGSIICRHGSKLSTHAPFLQSPAGLVGGVLSPVISSASEEPLLLLQGLLTLGVRQNRAHKASTSYLNKVRASSFLK